MHTQGVDKAAQPSQAVLQQRTSSLSPGCSCYWYGAGGPGCCWLRHPVYAAAGVSVMGCTDLSACTIHPPVVSSATKGASETCLAAGKSLRDQAAPLKASVGPRESLHHPDPAPAMIRLRSCALCWALLGAATLVLLYQAGTCYSWGSFPSFPYRDPLGARQPRARAMPAQPPVTLLGSRAPSSTLQPFLGDLYGRDETYQSSRCPSGIRKRIVSTKFTSVFLEAIPVLQWAQHARPAEYRRLQNYGGAHGWQEVGWPVVRDTLSRLNASANGRMFDAHPRAAAGGSPCVHCAVVGNGGILNGSRAGAAIDRHDYVFRTNGALTKGFERDVGRRTSFYIFSTNTMMNSLHNYASNGFRQLPQTLETRYIFLPDHDRDYLLLRAALTHRPVDRGSDEGARPEQYFGKHLRAEKFKMFHPDFIRYVRNRFLRSSILDTPQWRLYRPSTGAVMLLAALHTCDEVSAYGFITPNYQAYSEHYFDPTHKALLFYANHDLRLEMSLWQELHQSQLITLHTRG
ncbi:alpha-N-acetylgalactosaminide alpha-2,6-sialyltransferase 2-like isoform X4 [Gopherus evgoodei]|uniref:alpha-N-acetylgalactosaminide alpha-2,6-sialyltransferase n=2 Tax=Gopherus evgoodei TaxID=1825980 RepID=A0A8C4W569_9SAUR|nr:alpha-N-acetylgalactosaminide alpha-2,6-sialyltransferase 2-like isoform X4 [Gopherus evgoodei]XP_030389801.1 alpha-N-acetylgalactosaminide alpha-2,6-sialyltransferase 2-like isoform X4 [Gopherus evgoodei]